MAAAATRNCRELQASRAFVATRFEGLEGAKLLPSGRWAHEREPKEVGLSSDVMIEADALTKRYGSLRALDKVSFEVHRGEVVGFLGPNGAGKSTTMRILTCFISATSGSAKVHGHDVFDDPLE